jgi:hypothetical protein
MSIPAAAHVVAWLALGTGVGVVLVRQHDLGDRLERAEADRADAPAASSATSPSGPAALASGKATIEARARVEELQHKYEATVSELSKLRADHDRLVATVMATPEGQAAAETSSKFVEKPGFSEAVRAEFERYAMEQKFRDTLKKATGPIVPKKPLYAELAKALKLTGNQSTRFEEDIRGIQTELFQILQVPREDGVVPLEEIQQAEQYPEGSPKKTEIFLKLFKDKIPGTEETYIERAMVLVKQVKKSTESYLDDSQRNLLDTIDLDWFGIKMQ